MVARIFNLWKKAIKKILHDFIKRQGLSVIRTSELESLRMAANAKSEPFEEMWSLVLKVPAPDRSKEYLSCEWIESGLAFLNQKVTACCVGFSNGGMPPLAEFSGGDLPIRKILTERWKIISENQNKGFALCKGCIHLTKKKWEPRRWLFKHVLLNHFTACNIRCRYCYSVKDKRNVIPPSKVIPLLPTFKYMVDNRYLSPDATIYFGGGEPTVLSEFEELVSYLTDYGTRFSIFSNAVIFSKAIVKSLLARKIGTLLLSIDAGTKKVYKILKGGDFCDRVWDNTAKYIKADKNVVWPKIILCKENVNDIIQFVERSQKAGAKKLVYDIDAGMSKLSSDVINAAAEFKYECLRRGIEPIQGEAGIPFYKENRASERIEKKFNEIVSERGDPRK